jgi:hypothetical protein
MGLGDIYAALIGPHFLVSKATSWLLCVGFGFVVVKNEPLKFSKFYTEIEQYELLFVSKQLQIWRRYGAL